MRIARESAVATTQRKHVVADVSPQSAKGQVAKLRLTLGDLEVHDE